MTLPGRLGDSRGFMNHELMHAMLFLFLFALSAGVAREIGEDGSLARALAVFALAPPWIVLAISWFVALLGAAGWASSRLGPGAASTAAGVVLFPAAAALGFMGPAALLAEAEKASLLAAHPYALAGVSAALWAPLAVFARPAGAKRLLGLFLVCALPVAVPHTRVGREAGTRTGLDKLREQVGRYRERHGGRAPSAADVGECCAISDVPKARPSDEHPDSAQVRFGTAADDSGGWMLDNVEGDARFGQIWVNCTHTDTRGRQWAEY